MHCESIHKHDIVEILVLTSLLISASNSTLQRPIILAVFQGTNVTVDNIHEVNSPFWTNLVRR